VSILKQERNKHILVRESENEVREEVVSERVMTNQEVYDYFAKIKCQRKELEMRLNNAKDTVDAVQNALIEIDKVIEKWEPIARDCEKRIPKPSEVKKNE